MSKKKTDSKNGEKGPELQSHAAVNNLPTRSAVGVAGFDFAGYNRQFMDRQGAAALNDAATYGPNIKAIEIERGQSYWKIIGIHHLTPDENRDRHHAFIEALDEAGNRVKDGSLRLGWIWEGKNDGPAEPKRLDKPDNEPAADVPLEKNMTVTLWLEGAGPSEQVTGLHTRHEDEVGPGSGRNSRFHHSYYIVFQRTTATDDRDEGETGGETPRTDTFRFHRWPTDTVQITQTFGANPDFYATYNLPGHEGVDIVAKENDRVYCVAPGQIKMVNSPQDYAQNRHVYGVHVRVAHAEGYETIYAHLKEVHVQVGQKVAAGAILGLADHTGNVVGDPPDHLHLTLKRVGEGTPGYPNHIIDPMPFLRPLLGSYERVVVDGPKTVQKSVAAKLGLNCNAPVDAHGTITPRLTAPQLIKETGVKWVRLNFIVRPFASPDDPQWIATYREIINGLREQGLQIYGLIGAEAVAEDPGNEFRNAPPDEPTDHAWIRTYARNFRKIVELFGRDVPVFESFNEPNDWHRTPSDSIEWEQAWVHPAWFAIMLQRVFESVRDLDLTLVSGPLLSTEHGNDAAAYLPRVYAAGIERFSWGRPSMPVPFDGVGFHPYVLSDSFEPEADIPLRYEQYVAEVRAVIERYDSPDKPLFISEIGWQNPDERQAACMAIGLKCAMDDPTIALCIWYGMQDDDAEFYGLYRKDGLTPDHRKPVFERFVSLATSPRTVPVALVLPKPSTAKFVAELDSVPDDTLLAAGSGFTKVWRLQNTGATTWREGYALVLVGGESLGAPERIIVPPCPPGQTVDIAVSFVAPSSSGQHLSVWSLADPDGKTFGDQVWTRIQVAAPQDMPSVPSAPSAIPHGVGIMPPGLSELTALPADSPLMATALGIIYQTYWLRVWAAATEPNSQEAIQAAADAALASIRSLTNSD